MADDKYTVSFPVRLTEKMSKEIRAIAAREYLTISQLMRRMLREGIARYINDRTAR